MNVRLQHQQEIKFKRSIKLQSYLFELENRNI